MTEENPPGRARAAPVFSELSLIALGGIVGASMLFGILVVAFAEDIEEIESSGADSYSRSAIGHRLLFDFLDLAGIDAARSRYRTGEKAKPGVLLVVAEPTEEFPRLRRWIADLPARGGAILLVLPKWRGEPSAAGGDLASGWIGSAALLEPDVPARVLRELPTFERTGIVRTAAAPAAWDSVLGAVAPSLHPPLQLLAHSTDLAPLVSCEDGVLLARSRLVEGCLVLSDPDLLNNHGLAAGPNGPLAAGLFSGGFGDEAVDRVVLDEITHGYELEPNFLREAFRFPLVLGTLHFGMILALLVWAGAPRFGKPLPAAAARTASSGERIVEDLAWLLVHAGKSTDSLPKYFERAIHSVEESLKLPPTDDRRQRLARLETISQGRGLRIHLARLEGHVRALAARRKDSPHEVTRIADLVHRWRMRMTTNEDR